ncbi:MAG: TetR/AcrR family transcriptional regulator [Sandaracinaceae bacterium]|nr:TetR/AcrR family transcriptional regulator [Sandaracinaceae bacterium]
MLNPRRNEPTDTVKQRILAAGRAEFARHGLSAGSVRAIGDRAGVTPAMINYYFGGKRALYDAVVAEAQGRLRARLTAAVTAGREGLAPRLAGAYFDFLADDQELQRLLLREVLDQGERARARRAARAAAAPALRAALRTGRRGDAPRDQPLRRDRRLLPLRAGPRRLPGRRPPLPRRARAAAASRRAPGQAARGDALHRIVDPGRRGASVSVFHDRAQFEGVMAGLFERLRAAPAVAGPLGASAIVVRFRYPDLGSVITFDFRRTPPRSRRARATRPTSSWCSRPTPPTSSGSGA